MLIHVQFTREFKPSLFGRAIVWWSGKPFSHARIKYQDSANNWKVFHAIEEGVCVEDFVPGSEILVASFPCELRCSLDHFEGVVYGSLGKEYSMSQILAMALPDWFKFKNSRSKFVCSELVGQILVDFYPEFSLPKDQDNWEPWDIYAALLDHFLFKGLAFERYPKVASPK